MASDPVPPHGEAADPEGSAETMAPLPAPAEPVVEAVAHLADAVSPDSSSSSATHAAAEPIAAAECPVGDVVATASHDFVEAARDAAAVTEASTAIALEAMEAAATQESAPVVAHQDVVARQEADLAEAAATLEALRRQAEAYAGQGAEAVETRAAELRGAAGAMGKALEESFAATSDALLEFNQKLADSMRINVESTIEFWTALMGTRSLSEAVALNAQHIRKQMEALTSQSKELSSLAQKLAVRSVQPLRDTTR